MKLLSPGAWKDYELIDSGDFEKLERFGSYTLIRPEPQAVWSRNMSYDKWKQSAHARFSQEGSHTGTWEKYKNMEEQWYINYQHKQLKLRFRLGLTAFKHVGIFPEQAVNWNYIFEHTQKIPQARVLNLFAYTGGASLAARAAKADVIHCDAVRSVLNWAKSNMEASRLDNIRWLLEDALKYVKREAKRGKKYHGIIMDPPAFGNGPKGEKWKLEDMINELTTAVSEILEPEKNFLVFNSYSLGFSALVLENLLITHFGHKALRNLEMGELYLAEGRSRKMPMGIFARFHNLT